MSETGTDHQANSDEVADRWRPHRAGVRNVQVRTPRARADAVLDLDGRTRTSELLRSLLSARDVEAAS